jgi:hypothetical protein
VLVSLLTDWPHLTLNCASVAMFWQRYFIIVESIARQNVHTSRRVTWKLMAKKKTKKILYFKNILFLVINVCSFTIYCSAHSSHSVPMTKRKSGLPADDDNSSGITSLCNRVSRTDKRAAALAMETVIKRAQRYDTLTLTDLASWPSLLVYKTLPQRLKDHVFEYYMWQQLHANSSITREQIKQAFDSLNNHGRDTLTEQLCDKHAVIEYTLRSQVLPEYITHHVTSGSQTVHWQPVSLAVTSTSGVRV